MHFITLCLKDTPQHVELSTFAIDQQASFLACTGLKSSTCAERHIAAASAWPSMTSSSRRSVQGSSVSSHVPLALCATLSSRSSFRTHVIQEIQAAREAALGERTQALEKAQAEASAAIEKAEKAAAATLEEARAKAAEIVKEQEQLKQDAETARQQVGIRQQPIKTDVCQCKLICRM